MTNRTKIVLSASTILSSMALAATAQAQAVPSGGSVEAGSATISTTGNLQTITQTSERAVINWTDFSIASGSTVVFTQPAGNSATLNRVTGTAQSTIAGNLISNGAVYIVNPNGIQITSSGLVSTSSGFVASTLDITDDDFMAGAGTFGGDGTGTVSNRGTIVVGTNGYVGLLGGQVDAGGTIAAGTIVIGAVEAATLDLNGGGFLQLVMPGITPGSTHITLGAGSARAAVRGAVNLPGSVEATYVTGTNGNVTLSSVVTGAKVLVAGTGDVTVSGTTILAGSGPMVIGARGGISVNAALSSGADKVILRADAAGTGTGTVDFGTGGSLSFAGTGQAVDIFYNPASYAAPTNFSANLVGAGAATATLNAYMLVNDVNQLQAMDTNLAGIYALGRDIDASATAGWNGGAGFDPIGSSSNHFTGTLNGQGHVISGLTIDREYFNDIGLFASLESGSLIHDLSLDGGSVTGFYYTGALAARSTGGTIRNVSSSMAVTGDYDIGGLVGVADGTTIANAFVSGAVSGISNIGGLVGETNDVSINNAFVSGAVSGGSDVGGVIGFDILESVVSNVHVSGSITGSSFVGGVIGTGVLTNVSNAYWDTYSTGRGTAIGDNLSATVNATAVTSDPAQSAAANYAFTVGTYSSLDLTNTWFQAEGMRPILRSLANPAVGGVIDITNVYQLQLMGANLGASYRLANDIDASLADGSDISGIWDSRGFAPVGDGSTAFTGAFNGQGHVISGLTINRPDKDYIGLFGYSSGSIRDVGLLDVDLEGYEAVGGIAGVLLGSIDNAYVTGSITGYAASGGLAGYGGGVIQNSYTAVSLSGYSRTGGLVGNSYQLAISNSYSSGAVAGYQLVGGLIGVSEGNTVISKSYAAGAVSGTSDVGGLLGFNPDSTTTTTDSYWNMETTGRTGSLGRGTAIGGTGLTTEQMQQAASFTNWDISGTGGEDTIWRIYEGSTAPLLRSFLTPLTVSLADATVTYDGTMQSLDSGSYTLGSGGNPALVFGTLTGGVSGTDAGAYHFTDPVGLYSNQQGYDLMVGTGTLTIDPRAITVTADAQSRIYGDANPALTYTVGGQGLVGGDTLSGALATAATVTSNVGTYGITQGTLAASSNYTLTYVGADLTVTPRALSVVYTADAANRIYGDANPALTGSFSATGLVNGNTLSGTAIWTTLADLTSDVGSYGVTGSGLSASSNYTLNASQAPGNASALIVTPRALDVVYTADALSRIYGDANPVLTGSVAATGLVNGDTLSGTVSWASVAGVTSDIGSYAVTGSGLSAGSNYTLNASQAAGNASALTVTPRAVTVLADAASRIYGDANPALTYTVGGMGLANGDTLGGALATSATAASDVGTYGITHGTLAASPNYTLAYEGAELTITPRMLAIIADAQSRLFGFANPQLTYGVSGLVNGDSLTGALATAANVASLPGTYSIDLGTLAASANYVIDYTPAELTVMPVETESVSNVIGGGFGQAPGIGAGVSGNGAGAGEAGGAPTLNPVALSVDFGGTGGGSSNGAESNGGEGGEAPLPICPEGGDPASGSCQPSPG
ncbi:beta strand repeat-containing protein [Alteraurantiacibacter aquimixticola]|uniref:Filamentous hemagglutinin N-terminal domain-containing protein n=1 Tax=Alteraurantiacibacter aquimixticola TaxID=2489173 RepID=A0A4T3F3T0_9SPHN|nr:MBG domain-containing protein [Alteraurantiacibacter aquimixticola]TIX50934.1 filamentous hemagglutinin N-terminal domain-containing protein [Alteraurantiacibacter aquimixticola]